VAHVAKQLCLTTRGSRCGLAVRGRMCQIWVNQMLVVDYVEPETPFRADPKFERVLNHGTFALQATTRGARRTSET